MKNNKQTKKGEMTSTQLITVILLIIGFCILLYVFYTSISNTDSDRKVCHTSVVLRGTMPDVVGTDSKEVIPLKCRTKRLCVSDKLLGKGECSESLGKDFETARVSSDAKKKENEIKKILAEEMADCWAMMGEGKIQVFKREVLLGKRSCVVCSRVVFDKNIKLEKIEGLSNYLLTKKIYNKNETYFQFLTHSKEPDVSLSSEKIDSLDTNEKAIIFTEFGKSKLIPSSGIIISGVLGAQIGSIVPGIGTGVGFVIGALSSVIFNNWVDDNRVTYLTSIYIADYDTNDLSKLNCDSIESIS